MISIYTTYKNSFVFLIIILFLIFLIHFRSGYTTYWAEESERHKAQKNSRMLAKSALRDGVYTK